LSATGVWNAHIISLMGSNPVRFDLVEIDGVITGTATGEGETVPIVNGTAKDNDLVWDMSITRPTHISFRVKLRVNGDTWEGTAQAKMFPPARVVGQRQYPANQR
jgi:hypothetical protein